MGNPNYGIKVEWAKHLRKEGKREFWNRLRTFHKQELRSEEEILYTLEQELYEF